MIWILAPIYLALASRVHGGWLGVPKVLAGALYALLYAALMYAIGYNEHYGDHYVGFLAIIITIAWVTVWKGTGHADGFQMGRGKNELRNQFLTPAAVLIYRAIFRNRKHVPMEVFRGYVSYDVIFMALKGALIPALPAALAAFGGHYLLGLGLFLGGAVGLPLAYFIAMRPSTSLWAELLSGMFAGLGFLPIILMSP